MIFPPLKLAKQRLPERTKVLRKKLFNTLIILALAGDYGINLLS
jgi:hypothetical protein